MFNRDRINEYIVDSIAKFEQGWKIHEAELLKYELNQAKLTSYE